MMPTPEADTSPVFIFVPTHTARYLEVVLAGLARQTRKPDHVVVSCDTDDASIGALVERWSGRLGGRVSWVRRGYQGVARLSQVRNNAVRFLVEELGQRTGRVIQIDGDVLCSDTLVERHALLGARGECVYPHRIDVSREASESLDPERVWNGEQGITATAGDMARLRGRDRRYRRHLLLRRLGLCPLHKPKLLGCNWSGTIEVWRALNGFDELYQGWGYADDEFARRAARLGASCVAACADILAYHLFHATRQPAGAMTENPNHGRFLRRDLPIRAERGLMNPLDQPRVQVTRFG